MIGKMLAVFLLVFAVAGCASAPHGVDSSLYTSTRVSDMQGYSDGLAAVRVDEKWGYADTSGALVILPQFSQAGSFSEGFAPVRFNTRWGLIDKNGNYVIIPTYEGLGEVSQGLVPVKMNGKWGYLKQPDKVVIQPQFDEAGPFRQGLALVDMGSRKGFINSNGQFVVNPRFAFLDTFGNGLAPASLSGKQDSFGYVDGTGEFKVKATFDMAGVFSDGLAPVLDDGKWGYIDPQGRMAINLKYDEAGPFQNGLAPVKLLDKWGYIDREGAIVIAYQFARAYPFTGDNALVVDLNGKGYYIDRSGRQLHSLTGSISVPSASKALPVNTSLKPAVQTEPGQLSSFRQGSKAGFITLEPIEYSLQNEKNGITKYKTSESRIFYSFHPANPGSTSPKTLFVMLNGGPGAGTVVNLLSMNTAPYTLDREHQVEHSGGYSENKFSWTSIGNLLYIDAPATGFSYMVSPESGAMEGRRLEFMAKGNFNPFIDAAQIVRTILRFMEDKPEMRDAEVVLVGESYGGTRVSTMLNLLLFHDRYADGSSVFRDEGLVREIKAHFKALFHDQELTPKVVAGQFGRQVLIQPELSGGYQDEISGYMFFGKNGYKDSVMKDLAREAGHEGEFDSYYPFKCRIMGGRETAACAIMYWVPHFNRDLYNSSKRSTWSNELEAYAAKSLRNTTALSTVLQYDVAEIKPMYATARKNAYRLIFGIATGEGFLSDKDNPPGSVDWYADPQMQKYLPKNPAAMARLISWGESQAQMYKKSEDGRSYSEKDMNRVFGSLNYWDKYLVEMNLSAFFAFTGISDEVERYLINPDSSPRYGLMFLENLTLVNTFLTDAAHDLVIYSPAIPEALLKYTDVVSRVTYKRGSEAPGGELQGTFKVEYKPGVFNSKETQQSASIYYPYYAKSGHSVSSAQPEELLSDITIWLKGR